MCTKGDGRYRGVHVEEFSRVEFFSQQDPSKRLEDGVSVQSRRTICKGSVYRNEVCIVENINTYKTLRY